MSSQARTHDLQPENTRYARYEPTVTRPTLPNTPPDAPQAAQPTRTICLPSLPDPAPFSTASYQQQAAARPPHSAQRESTPGAPVPTAWASYRASSGPCRARAVQHEAPPASAGQASNIGGGQQLLLASNDAERLSWSAPMDTARQLLPPCSAGARSIWKAISKALADHHDHRSKMIQLWPQSHNAARTAGAPRRPLLTAPRASLQRLEGGR